MRRARNVIVLAAVMVAAGCTSGSGGGGEGGEGGMGGDTGPAGSGNTTSTFSKSYGGPLHDEARVVLNTSDGGFLLLGTADSNTKIDLGQAVDGGDWWLQKLDVDGNVEVTRLFGGENLPAQTVWTRARPLRDGGGILAGANDLKLDVRRSDGSTASIRRGRDFAVTRLDASGAVSWSVSYDSGPWTDYDYVVSGYDAAEASDLAADVWPAADGGFFVAGSSVANLQDLRGIGFPCADAEIATLSGRSCADRPPNAGSRFLSAFSIVVLRLNEDGSLRWMRRLTDNAFNAYGNYFPSDLHEPGLDASVPMAKTTQSVILRPTADGGVVLARSIVGGILVHRFEYNGSQRWRAEVAGVESPTAIVETSQGYAVVGDDHVIQLNADGSIRWRRNLAEELPHGYAVVDDATQSCDPAAPAQCYLVAVGSLDTDGAGGAPARGVAWLLDADGNVSAVADATAGVGATVLALSDVTPGDDNSLELLAVREDYALARAKMRLAISGAGSSLVFTDYRSGTEPAGVEDQGNWRQRELRADGGVLELTDDGATLRAFDARCLFLSQLILGDGAGGEGLEAAAQIGEGRYVLAGSRRENGIPQVVVLRYDIDRDAVVWQRRIAAPSDIHGVISRVPAAASSPDGGVVLSLVVNNFESSQGLLLKLDANGNPQWQVEIPRAALELHPTSSGTITALSQDEETRVTRVSPAGQILWEKSVAITGGATRFTTMTPAAGSGMVLAGSAGTTLSLLRLEDDGSLGSAREVQFGSLAPDAWLRRPKIRETSNGDFIVALTESALLTRASPNADQPVLYGEDNIFVLKVDATGNALWGRVYGAALSESVRALSLRNDGNIAVAGYSDSLGDGREAWLLKLSPDGLVAASGCQALLGSLPVAGLASVANRSGEVTARASARSSSHLATMTDANLPVRVPRDFITARQCQGIAGGGVAPGSGVTPGGSTQRLTVETLGQRGVITSLPAGISCGTGLDICAADFARGSVVTLRADPERFVAWLSACEADSGGTQLTCVVTMNADRTVQADFRPPPPAGHFTLSFEIQGPGSVAAGDINCREDTQPRNCSHAYTEGARVVIRAFPEQNWVGSDFDAIFLGWSGDEACASLGAETSGFITVDHDVHCIARFRAPNLHLLSIFGSVGGEVTDDPPSTNGIHCREIHTGTCLRRHASTTTVPLVADPDFGYRFVGWGGDCASFGSATNIAVVVADNTTCTATFERATTPQTLTVFFSEGGPDRIIESDPPGIHCFMGSVSGCSASYAPGTQVFLTSNYPGTDWIGCDRKFKPIEFGEWVCRVDMDQQPRVATAYFPPR